MGKQNLINNFCIAVYNWPRCTICHIGYGWKDNSFDFTDGNNMDASLLNPTPEINVHQGQYKFTCATCYAGENHAIPGASHGSAVTGSNHIVCVDCHSENKPERLDWQALGYSGDPLKTGGRKK